MNRSAWTIVSKKGYVEICVAVVLLLINRIKSATRIASLKIRGYSIATSVIFKGSFGVSQSNKRAISIGKSTVIGKDVRMDAGYDGTIRIGKNVLIDDNCFITSQKSITVGNNVMIAAYSFITDFNHAFRSKKKRIDEQGFERSAVVIEDDVWIGTHVCILKGVTIGRGAVIGAGSVVTRNVKPYEIVAGNPAKHIRYRT